jgi:leucine dehydrogenase
MYGSNSVKGRTIAIQGLGSVGSILASTLFWNGAHLIVTDVNESRALQIAKQYSATYVSPQEIVNVACDVFSPCALGGGINRQTIPGLQCRAIAGAANNQLWEDTDGDLLVEKGILYAPDYVINAGGLINVAAELFPQGYDPVASRNRVDALYDQLLRIFDSAEKTGLSTHKTAQDMADEILKKKIGKRTEAPCFRSLP